MPENAKRAIVGLPGGMGFIFILLGALAHIYPVTTCVLIAFVCWLGSGVLARDWEVKKKILESLIYSTIATDSLAIAMA